MDVQVNVSLNGIEEKLYQLGPKLSKIALRKALKAGIKLIQDEAKTRAPVDSGDLRDSIQTVVRMSPKQDKGTASVGPTFDVGGLKKGSDKDKSQSPGVYGLIVEFGNKRQAAQPFLRSSYDSKADAVVEKFVEVLRAGLTEAVK